MFTFINFPTNLSINRKISIPAQFFGGKTAKAVEYSPYGLIEARSGLAVLWIAGFFAIFATWIRRSLPRLPRQIQNTSHSA